MMLNGSQRTPPPAKPLGVKTMSLITSLRTWLPPGMSSCCSVSQCPGLPVFHQHRRLQSGTALNVLAWVHYQNPGSKSQCPGCIQLIGPCFPWRPWSGDGQIEGERVGWGEGRQKSAWPGAQCHTALGRDEEGAGSGQPKWLVCGGFFTWRKRRWIFDTPLPPW